MIEYGAWMAEMLGASLTLLGVLEENDEYHPVQDIFGRAVTFFQEKKLPYNLQLINGETEEVLAGMSWDENTYLFIGPLGRPQFKRWLVGRSFQQIIEDVPTPIFYIREARLPIKKILVCFGGLGYSEEAKKIGFEIAQRTKASLTLLHVVPIVDLDYPPIKEMQENWNHLLDTDTPPARVLKKAQKNAEEKGILANVVVRHGDIIRQIVEELNTENYDLICMGSTFSHSENLRQLYTPNVTAEIAKETNSPILTARSL